MPRRVYHEINLHIVWRTKDSAPVIGDAVRRPLYGYVCNRARETEGVLVHEIGGTADHVHLAVSVPPTLLISDWIGDLKGASAHYINHRVARRRILFWQTGYGVVSFGKQDLRWVKTYIRDQERHHASGKTHDRLERIEPMEGEKPVETG